MAVMMETAVRDERMEQAAAGEGPGAITHLDYATVMVKDQEAARRFYTEVLGFEVADDERVGTNVRWLTVRPRGAQSKLVLYTDPEAHDHGAAEDDCCGSGGCGCCGSMDYAWTGMVMATDDIEASFHDLRSRGVKFLQAPEQKPWGVKDALFSDPDGNVFNLVQKH
jgi:catechol 2,3-dioxygenase-like lactoylglutathione lyase family enzyme